MLEFNLNRYVWVKLTDEGRAELKRQYDETYLMWSGEYADFVAPIEDKDGWSRWQGWCLFAELGHMLNCGASQPFETSIRFDSEDMEEVEDGNI